MCYDWLSKKKTDVQTLEAFTRPKVTACRGCHFSKKLYTPRIVLLHFRGFFVFFLPGERNIHGCIENIQRRRHTKKIFHRRKKKIMKTNILEEIFTYISETINGGERAILDALSAIVPYTTAAIPAYLTYTHTRDIMMFPPSIAGLAAFTVEVLGVTAVSTAIRFLQWNQTHKDKKEKAPFMLAIGTYLFYVAITLSVNVVLEVYTATRAPAIIWAIALFSLLSIPSGVLISIRAQFGEMLEDKRERAEQRKADRAAARGGAAMRPAFGKDVEGLPELQEVSRKSGGTFRK